MAAAKESSRYTTGRAPMAFNKARQKSSISSHSVVNVNLPHSSNPISLRKRDPSTFPSQGCRNTEANAMPLSTVARVPLVKPTFRLLVLGPAISGSQVSFDNPAVLDLLDLVRQRHSVTIINGEPFPNSLTIYSMSPYNLRAAHEDICHMVHSVGSKGYKQLLMVHPLYDEHRRLVLIEETINPGWSRFVFRDNNGGRAVSGPDDRAPSCLQADAFRSRFSELARLLRTVPSNLVLQVHFGRIILFTKGKTMPGNSQAAATFNRTLAEPGGERNFVFDRRIGDAKMFNAFQQQIIAAKEDFYPCSSVIEDIADVQLQKYLVIITDSFRIELRIGPPGSAPDGRSAKLSHLRVFQMLGTEGRIGMVTACPGYCADWKLEAIPELKPDEIPSSIKAFLGGVAVVYSQENHDFPMPVVRTGSITAYRVRQMYGKTSWAVGCRGTQYVLELNLFHKFPKEGTNELYSVSTGASFSNRAWEEVLEAPSTNGGSRDLGVNWSKLFRPRGNRDGVVDFLSLIQRPLFLWNGITSRPSAFDNRGCSEMMSRNSAQKSTASVVYNVTEAPGPSSPKSFHNISNQPIPEEEDLIVLD